MARPHTAHRPRPVRWGARARSRACAAALVIAALPGLAACSSHDAATAAATASTTATASVPASQAAASAAKPTPTPGEPIATASPAVGKQISAQNLKEGTCLGSLGPRDSGTPAAESTGGTEGTAATEASEAPAGVSSVEELPCAAPHAYEVYHNASLEGEALPTGEALTARIRALCLPAFEDYVGTPYEDSRIDVTYLAPTATSWALGDRAVTCLLVSPEGSENSASLKGSKR